jgi:hypothetical protein
MSEERAGRRTARPLSLPPDDRITSGRGQTGGMQNPQPSGARGFALLVGVMVAIVLVIMAIAVIFSP